MLPAVAEVVLVAEAFVDTEFEIAQSNLVRISREARAAVVVHAIVLAMDVKQIKMRVAPAEGDLQRVMQVGDRAVTAYQ